MPRTHSLLLVCATLTLGVAGHTAQAAPASAPGPLFDRLTHEIGAGGPVAVVAGKEGILALSLDGSRRQVLVPGAVRWVFVDNRARVLWFERAAGKSAELWLLDLTQSSPQPERVVSGIPKDELLAVGYTSKRAAVDEAVRPRAAEYVGCLQLLLEPPEPKLKRENGIYDEIFEDQAKQRRRAAAQAKILPAALPRLRELAQRTGGGHLALAAEAQAKPRKIKAVAADRCKDPELCGEAERIPGTPLLRVLVEHRCGDACHTRWQLYDPRSKQFIDYKTGRKSPKPIDRGQPGEMSDAFVSSDGKAFIIDSNVYSVGGGRVFTGQGKGGGWLGGAWQVR